MTHVSSIPSLPSMQARSLPHAGRDRKGDRTRERLFQAALEEFRAQGLDQAGVGQIARRAGTSRAAFYFHYPSKDAVLLDLQWRVELEILDATRDVAGLRPFLVALIDALCAADTGICAGGLMRTMLGVYIRRPAGIDLADQPFPLMMEVARRFAAASEDGLRSGLDPVQATDLFLSALFGLVASSPGPVLDRRPDLLQLASLFLAGDALPRE